MTCRSVEKQQRSAALNDASQQAGSLSRTTAYRILREGRPLTTVYSFTYHPVSHIASSPDKAPWQWLPSKRTAQSHQWQWRWTSPSRRVRPAFTVCASMVEFLSCEAADNTSCHSFGRLIFLLTSDVLLCLNLGPSSILLCTSCPTASC